MKDVTDQTPMRDLTLYERRDGAEQDEGILEESEREEYAAHRKTLMVEAVSYLEELSAWLGELGQEDDVAELDKAIASIRDLI